MSMEVSNSGLKAKPRSSSCQAPQDFDAAVQHRVADGVTDAEMRVALAESIAGDNQQVVANSLGHEGVARAPRNFREQIKRPTGDDELIPVLESGDETLAFMLVIAYNRG